MFFLGETKMGFSVPANPGFAGCAQVTLETEKGDRGDAKYRTGGERLLRSVRYLWAIGVISSAEICRQIRRREDKA